MFTARKGWIPFCLAFGILFGSVAAAAAATNEYYSSAVTKEIIDGLIKASGGAEKIKAIDRIKVVMDASVDGKTMRATILQTKSHLRREVALAPEMKVIEIYDGKDVATIVNGKRAPKGRPKAKEEMDAELKEGVFQAALLDDFVNRERHVKYLGKKVFGGKSCDLIETIDARQILRQHYLDPQSHREIFRIKHQPEGAETSIFEDFSEFKGVLYPSKMTFKKADGSVSGRARVAEISSNFDDSVFVAPR
jgi:hypothetical protein